MEEAVAVTKYVRVSPTKIRLVVDQIRGKKIEQAMQILEYSRKRCSRVVMDTLKSAVANAENNLGMDVDTLVVSRIYVDKGAVLKRVQPMARGRAFGILKRTSHITVAVRPETEG